jgi:hypothetical protein
MSNNWFGESDKPEAGPTPKFYSNPALEAYEKVVPPERRNSELWSIWEKAWWDGSSKWKSEFERESQLNSKLRQELHNKDLELSNLAKRVNTLGAQLMLKKS